MPPGGDPAFLIFWFFCIKTKERTIKQPQVCLYIKSIKYFLIGYLRSFCLTKKNQKIKTNPIPPGVLSGLYPPGRRPIASVCQRCHPSNFLPFRLSVFLTFQLPVFLHHLHKIIKQIAGIMRTGRSFRVILNRKRIFAFYPDPFNRIII